MSQRLQEKNSSFSKETEKKLAEKMEAINENKNMKIAALQKRLKEHVSLMFMGWVDPEVRSGQNFRDFHFALLCTENKWLDLKEPILVQICTLT